MSVVADSFLCIDERVPNATGQKHDKMSLDLPRSMMSEAIGLLQSASERFSRRELADFLGINERTVSRWLAGTTTPAAFIVPALHEIISRRHNEPVTGKFTFIDLFAGIGGTRLAFESIGGSCVFTSEWDRWAKKTYQANFAQDMFTGHIYAGDITAVKADEIPDHDVLVGGFPCQPFSIAGVSKKNALGRAHGFADTTQGTLFFDVARIIDEKRPVAFLLENVKNLISHDKGRTFTEIRRTLVEELGYELHFRIINGKHFTPQNRERILLVGFRDPSGFSFDDVELPPMTATMADVLHRRGEPANELDGIKYFDPVAGHVNDKYTLSDRLWAYLQNYADKHRAAGNGFGFGLVGPEGVARTLSARYYKDGSEILVEQQGRNPRRLTPRECARLMGFGEDFVIPVSDTQAYKQFGNSVVVPAIGAVANAMMPHIEAAISREALAG